MNVDVLKVGSLQANCYLVYEDKKCLIIDPGSDENFILKRIREKELEPVAILVTHKHLDHVSSANSIQSIYRIPIYSMDNLFEGNSMLEGFSFEVIYTPGHTSDSVCYYFKDYNIMFTGDFIFKDDIGRTDLETGSYKEMLESLNKIKAYPEKTVIYPGHGDYSTLGKELKNNNYV